MKQTLEEAAKQYAEIEMKKVLNVRATAKRSFIAGTKWAEKNKATSKAMCLRDKLKECSLCHECDVSVLNPSY
ncbi:hypothetical protein [Bacteroides xylanisolvens]|uniref:hypothetical protein n=1 Tax=Bacteroides xylanisolvens TaxID=371601 RepID=UPI00374E895B